MNWPLTPYNSRADVVRLQVERYDAKSNVKLGGFRSPLQASYMSSYTEELWYNETVGLWKTIYIYIYIYIEMIQPGKSFLKVWLLIKQGVQELWRFLSRVFGLSFSSLLLFPQHFGRCILRLSLGVCRTREPTQNFELYPLLNTRGRLFWFR